MPKSKKGLTDPVKDKTGSAQDAELTQDMKAFDPAAVEEDSDFLKPGEIGAIKERRVKAPHPFDGYRLGRKVPVGMDGVLSVSSTYIVLLNPHDEPQEDISNSKRTIYTSDKEGGGGDPRKPGVKAKVITLPTSHTRVVTNRRGNENLHVVFDREIMLGDGDIRRCAIVDSHAARAQLCYWYDDNKKKIRVDKRYHLADQKQAGALLELFKAIHYQRTGAERKADAFDKAQETTAADR